MSEFCELPKIRTIEGRKGKRGIEKNFICRSISGEESVYFHVTTT